MPNRKLDPSERERLLEKALSRWDTEGGAGDGRHELTDALPLTNTEITHLQVRVIALENLLKVLLLDASEDKLALMRDMAGFISPKPGYTQHPLTIHAAACMLNLVDSARHLREIQIIPSAIKNKSP